MPFPNPFSELKAKVDAMESDFEKSFDKGNHKAGTRVRKGCQELKNLVYKIRGEVLANQKGVEPKS